MKRIIGGVLMLAGAFSLYAFATRAMFNGRASMGSTYELGLPLVFVGMDYPTDALLLAGALWGFILGFWFIISGGDDGGALRGGRIARIMLMNGLLLLSTYVAFVLVVSRLRDSQSSHELALSALEKMDAPAYVVDLQTEVVLNGNRLFRDSFAGKSVAELARHPGRESHFLLPDGRPALLRVLT